MGTQLVDFRGNGTSKIVEEGGSIHSGAGLSRLVSHILARSSVSSKVTGAACRTRTDDLRFTKPLLYQLS